MKTFQWKVDGCKNVSNLEWRNRFQSLPSIQNQKKNCVVGVDPVILI